MQKFLGRSLFLILLFSAAESWALPQCPSSGVFHNCVGAWSFEGGLKYVGEWRNDKIHGQGTGTTADGEKYVGEYRDS
jgi:hypothetical protein